ncbi:MAG: nitrite reductase small subunit NirD [Pirellulales bacterium]|nr:nitrite reductase small subunit NirD [Pirellulales bacterium]
MCPHKNAFVLSRGILGNKDSAPKVACPLHKKPFSLKSGECLSGEDYSVKVFPVKLDGERVYVELPPKSQLDALLATRLHIIGEEGTNDCSACSPENTTNLLASSTVP